jgi:hypothetical protein
MLRIAFAGRIILATALFTSAKPLSTVHWLRRRNVNRFCYFSGHQPTEETYLQGVAQYCNNHVHDGISLDNRHELVVTMTLKDAADCPISWIYKMRWEDDAGVGPISISHDMCVRKFQAFVDDSTCTNGQKKYVVGENYWIEFGDKQGSRLYFETRQRVDDKYPQNCR